MIILKVIPTDPSVGYPELDDLESMVTKDGELPRFRLFEEIKLYSCLFSIMKGCVQSTMYREIIAMIL